MKIAILGSAPSSMSMAPIGDPSYKIWGCSPGVYATARRCDAWFELHRWEPGKIGVAESQKPWFSPEYVAWMAARDPIGCPVWMGERVPDIPASRRLPIEQLEERFGSYFFTSSISIMIACAIEDILEERAKLQAIADGQAAAGIRPMNMASPPPDEIALYGVDMSATEEYGYQRAGCQHMLCVAADLGIFIRVPPESDLLRPMPRYGLVEHTHWHIKNTVRMRELQQRRAAAAGQMEAAKTTMHFLDGAIDDLKYQMDTWGEDREGMGAAPALLALMPRVREEVLASLPPPLPPMEAKIGLDLMTILAPHSTATESPEITLRRILMENQAAAALAAKKKGTRKR